jgi:hypothetical protein
MQMRLHVHACRSGTGELPPGAVPAPALADPQARSRTKLQRLLLGATSCRQATLIVGGKSARSDKDIRLGGRPHSDPSGADTTGRAGTVGSRGRSGETAAQPARRLATARCECRPQF